MQSTIGFVSYKSPIEFRKRNGTAALDAARFQYLATDDRSGSSVMVFVGSPNEKKRFYQRPKDNSEEEKEKKVIITKEPLIKEAVKLMHKETDEIKFKRLVDKINCGIDSHIPELCEEGLNGTYFLKDKDGEMIGVFKPEDEEGNSKNNPKRDSFVDKGILDGEAARREVAAFLLDKDGFVGVPKTALVSISHSSFGISDKGEPNTKIGSLQEFVNNDGASWDIGFNSFPIQQVQKIAAFDIRIFNNDRHGGNMLFKRQSDDTYTLTPIDHGFSLPSTFDHAWFDWLTWPQVKEPITDEVKDYISKIDVEKDVQLLQHLDIRPECFRTMRISAMLLKKGCEMGLTLFDLGNIISRSLLELPSELELMIQKALKEIGQIEDFMTPEEEHQLLDTFGKIMDQELAKRKNNPCI